MNSELPPWIDTWIAGLPDWVGQVAVVAVALGMLWFLNRVFRAWHHDILREQLGHRPDDAGLPGLPGRGWEDDQ